ncbi:MAG: hypothetical protein AB1509_09485 [Chloroflexota bacterium]
MTAFLQESTESANRRIKFVLFTLALSVAWIFSSSFLGWGWVTAATITLIILSLNLLYIYRYRDLWLGHILLFGLAAGWTELLADRWLVEVTGTLTYAPGGPFVLRSPLYMPFAWANVLVQLACLGWWLSNRFNLPLASLLIGLFGAVNIPLYEQWANGANWWFYGNARMIGNTPWYIIGGEFLIVLTLPALMRLAQKAPAAWSPLLGIAQGLWIWAAYALAYALIG